MLKRTTKPLIKKSSDRRRLTKSSKMGTRRTRTSGIFVKQVVFHMVNYRGPLSLKELHSISETIVWRDPGGSWACLPPVYDCVWNYPATGCDIWTTPEKHTKQREILGNANQNKTTHTKEELSTRTCRKNTPKEVFRIKLKGTWWNAGQNKNSDRNS